MKDMYPDSVRADIQNELDSIREAGLYKDERIIVSPQGAKIRVQDGREVLNFCSNNYLGLSSHPRMIAAAHKALDDHGYGMSSVRFICGTQDIHKELEAHVSKFLGHEDTILYVACWDANGGLFETILTKEDAVISDALNHASIIDGIRLCKAARFRYKNADMEDLESKLKEARAGGARRVLIATDGVFSMDGTVAPLRRAGPHRHHHIDAGQGARRCGGRIHVREQGNRRPSAQPLATLPVQQHHAAPHRRRSMRSLRTSLRNR